MSDADTKAKAEKQQDSATDAGSAGDAPHTLQTAASDALKERALFFARELSAELSAYIVEKKETLRQNPESGAGSLFALPSDDSALAKIIARAEAYWKG